MAAHTIGKKLILAEFTGRLSRQGNAFKGIVMGIFNATIGEGNPGRCDLTEVSAVVDTGGIHTMLAESLLTQLRIRPIVE